MEQERFLISDAAKKVDVEAHVLRYWEEELGLPILRNNLGHRYYTEDNIRIFQNIKTLKDQGFQLKAIKLLLPELENKEPEALANLLLLKEELNNRAEEMEEETRLADVGQVTLPEEVSDVERRLLQFQEILGNTVRGIMDENNEKLMRQMRTTISNDIAEDLETMLRDQEVRQRQQQEEHFRQLDIAIRSRQNVQKEVAVTRMKPRKFRKKRRWGRSI